MRVLLLSTYFWPEQIGPAPYVTEPARFLARRGHEVEVWSGFPHYPAWRPLQARSTLSREQYDGMTIHRRFHHIPRTQNAATRALYESTLLLGALTSIGHARRPDVVLGVTPTLSGALAGAAVSRRFHVPFALLVHDLMGRAAEQSGVAGGGTVASGVRKLELAAARRASRIGIIAGGFRSYLREGGIPDARIVQLRTWNLTGRPTESRNAARRRLGWDGDFVVLHAGNIGHKQGLDNLVGAAALLDADSGVRVVIAGDGNDRPRLEQHARRLAVASLQFLNPQPWGRYEAMLKAADVLVMNQRLSVSDMSLPSKLTSYFAAGVPILAAVSPTSEAAHEVRRSRGGVVVPPDDPHALAGAIRELRGDPQLGEALGNRARDYAAEHLDPTSALLEYEAFLVDSCV
jgi:colanic acid biosynthesis glycosyl transferase WcaI